MSANITTFSKPVDTEIKDVNEQIGNKVECVTDTKTNVSTTAGTVYTVGAVSSYVPSGKTLVGLSKLKSSGTESGDYGSLQLNASGTNIVFMPTVTQTNVTIQFTVFYK